MRQKSYPSFDTLTIGKKLTLKFSKKKNLSDAKKKIDHSNLLENTYIKRIYYQK